MVLICHVAILVRPDAVLIYSMAILIYPSSDICPGRVLIYGHSEINPTLALGDILFHTGKETYITVNLCHYTHTHKILVV